LPPAGKIQEKSPNAPPGKNPSDAHGPRMIYSYAHRHVSNTCHETVAQPEWGRRGHGLSQNKLAKIFTGALYQFSTVRKLTEGTVGFKMTSVTVWLHSPQWRAEVWWCLGWLLDWMPPPTFWYWAVAYGGRHIHVCIFTWRHIHVCIFIWRHIHVCIFIWRHIYVCIFIWRHVHVCILTWRHINICIFIWRHIHVCKPTFWRSLLTQHAHPGTPEQR